MKLPSYGLIGRGRLATHLAHYLGLEGRQVTSWHRGSTATAADTLGEADTILLAISDAAIDGFLADNQWLTTRMVVHFCGSRAVDGAHGLHPLMTFGPDLYDLDTYRAIPFVGEYGNATFDEVFPDLANPRWSISTRDKPLYHALCVVASNFTTVLWSKAMRDFETRLGLPASAIRPLLEQTAANTLEHGRSSLSGPIARGESSTIESDLAGLEGDPYRDVYLAMIRAAASEGTPP
jgi:predicted short-subunit dehydrogenase-like oxidoreductase (DUF2520 family)